MDDPRDLLISKVVRGKTFADLGGLWGVVNEKVSVASRFGARSLTMIDRITKEEEEWGRFNERLQALGISKVECISKDILALADMSPYPQYDVVYCAGVLYHIPDPMRLMDTLRKVTREYLVLGSVITPEHLETEEGRLDISSGSCLFVPGLKGKELAIVRSYWKKFVADGAVGLTREISSWQETYYVPWWWLPTVGALQGMGKAAGFEFVEGAYFWNNNAYVQLLKVKG